MTANLGPEIAVERAAGGENDSTHYGIATSLLRSFGPEAALRVLMRDATGRLRTTLTKGSWPEEADTKSASRRRPVFDGAVAEEIRLHSPAGTVLLLLPMVLKDEPIGIVEILAPRATVAKHRAELPVFVESIAASHALQLRAPASEANGSPKTNGDRNGSAPNGAPRLGVVNALANTTDLDGVRVLIVDKHKLFAEVIRSVLEERGAEVLQPVENAEEALATARRTQPDVILIDLALNGSAMSLCRDIRQECPDVRVIGLTALASAVGQNEVLRSGFHGYLTKDVSLDRLVSSMRSALEGDVVVAHDQPRWTPQPTRTVEERHAEMLTSHLTPREKEVLELLVEGLSGGEIARRLSASPNTVRTHIQSILAKLQVHSRLQAATFAVKNRLVRIPGENAKPSDDTSPQPFDIGVARQRRNGQWKGR